MVDIDGEVKRSVKFSFVSFLSNIIYSIEQQQQKLIDTIFSESYPVFLISFLSLQTTFREYQKAIIAKVENKGWVILFGQAQLFLKNRIPLYPS